MEEVSGVFFLTLLTSSSLCPHSYGGRFWSVLPHCSLRHPCDLTPITCATTLSELTISLTSLSLWSHSLRHPCVLTPMTCLLTHLIVIPDFSLESSHPSHPWLLTPITRVTTHSILSVLTHTHSHRTNPSHLTLSLPSLVLPCSLIPACSHITPTTTHSHECSHTECSHTHRHPWLLTHTTRLTLTHSSPRSLSPHFSECSHSSLVFSHSPSHIECHHTEWSHITCVLRECLFPLPWCRPTTKSSHSHSLTHSHIHVIPVNTPMVSSYHQVYPLTALRGLVLPLTLPWCRTTTKSTHSLLWENLCSHSHFHGVVLPPSLPTHSHTVFSLTHTPMVSYYHQVITHPHQSLCSHSLPSTMSSHTLLPSLHFTSFSLQMHHKCITNASPTISHTLPPIMPPSHHHHLITSSYHLSPPIASSHSIQFILPLHFTPNPPNRLPNAPESQFIPITTIVAPHRLPNNIKPIQSRRWDKPQGLAGQSQLIPSQYPLHTKSSTKDCTDNTISFNTIQIVFLYPKRIKYSYVKYILSL